MGVPSLPIIRAWVVGGGVSVRSWLTALNRQRTAVLLAAGTVDTSYYYLIVVRDFTVPMVLAWSVILVAVPTNWVVVVALWRLLRVHRENRVLRDRFFIAIGIATVVTIFGAVFVNNDIIPPPFTLFQTQIVTRLAILSLTIPALYWLTLYRK